MRKAKRLARLNLEVALACVKPLKVQVKNSNAKHAMMVNETAQIGVNPRSRISPLEASLNTLRICTSQLAEVRVDGAAGLTMCAWIVLDHLLA